MDKKPNEIHQNSINHTMSVQVIYHWGNNISMDSITHHETNHPPVHANIIWNTCDSMQH